MERFFSGLTLSLLLVGCSARTLEVGSSGETGGSQALGSTGGTSALAATGGNGTCTVDNSPALPTWPSNDDCTTGTQQPQFLGLWDGYVQGTAIDDQLSTFLLNITAANETRVCGTLTFGDRTVAVTLPAATDRDAAYPPASVAATANDQIHGPFLGVAYTLQNGQRNGPRVTFKFAASEVFKQWCSLQTPYEYMYTQGVTPCSDYHCVQGGYMFSMPGPSATFTSSCQTQANPNAPINEVSCGKLILCAFTMSLPYCACNATQCAAVVSDSALFDLSFSGDTATGVYGSSTVLFHRVYTTDM